MQLLVSVVSEEEVAAAVEGGADIIDVKNPREGSLGANFPHVIRLVREKTPSSLAVSAAVGDVPNLPGTVALASLGAAACGVDYVKVGLFGVNRKTDAILLLREVRQAVRDHNPQTKVIATAYADAHKVGALPPLTLPEVAVKSGVDGCMLDTARKGEGNLLTLLDETRLRAFVQQCHDARLLCALAGSLDEADIPRVCGLGADIIGVRTAACQGDRINGRVDSEKVKRLKSLITASVSLSSVPWTEARPVAPGVPR